jgi:membrane protease subunit (stomatin/prohibitin family)
MEAAVKNESMGAAPFMGAGMGIGMGFGAGGVMAQSISEISGQTVLNSSTETEVCPQCHTKISPNQRFCSACGYKLLKTCPKCKAILQKNVKFCPECGEPIVRRCAKCGAFVVDDGKFCPECGESLKENL